MSTTTISNVYGYKIDDEFLFFSSSRLVLNVTRVSEESNKISFLKFRKTMSLLFTYLLENANDRIISDDELLMEVWDRRGLKGSNHRLWEVMKDLKMKLKELGLDDSFILRVNGNGYLLKDGMVSQLHCIA